MIWFNVRLALEQLEKRGEVYTLRPTPKRSGTHIMLTSLRTPRYRGTVRVEFVRVIAKPEELEPYVAKSGFASVNEWWDAAKGSRVLHHVTWVKRVG